MSQFGGRVDAFLDEFFHLYPVAATAMGMHAVDGEWPDLSPEAGRAARSPSRTAGNSELRAFADGGADAGRAHRSRPAALRAWRRCASTRRSCARTRGTRSATSTCWAAASSRCWPATSRRSLHGWRPWRRDWRDAGRSGRPRGASWGACPARPPSRLHTEMAIKQLPGIVALAEDAVAQAEAAATDQPGSGCEIPAPAAGGAAPPVMAIGGIRGVPAPTCCRAPRARAASAPSCSPGSCATPSGRT
jgi:hypothetical protein